MSVEKGRVFTGARARLLIDGKDVGYATSVSGSEEIEYQPVEALDNIEVSEYVPVAYRVTFSAGFVRVVGKTLKSDGMFPSTGKTHEDHLKNILLQGDLTVAVLDSKTKKTTTLLEGVKIASKNYTVNARGITGKDVSFVAIRMKDESEI